MVAALLLSYTGLTGFCLAMDRNHRRVWHRDAAPWAQIGLRSSGGVCLVLAFAICVMASGWSIGPVQWFGALSAAGLVLVFWFAYAPRAASLFALFGLLPALLLAVA